MLDEPSGSEGPNSAAAGAESAPGANVRELAAAAANRHRRRVGAGQRAYLHRHLRDLEKVLRKAHQRFASDPHLSLSAEGEWFLDNFHIVQQALRQVREDMPSRFYRELPTVDAADGERLPRVRVVAAELVRWSKSYLVFEQVRHYVRTYQAICGLTMGELWALPSMLRLGTLESLTRAAVEVTQLQPAQHGDSGSGQPPAGSGQPPAGQLLSADRTIANCILSLRGLAAHDWNEFFESVSAVERVLRSDPAAVYARMDFETRDQYRKVVERLAKATGREEKEIAQAAIRLAQEAAAEGQRTQHVGFYLIAEGRSELEASLGYRPGLRERMRRDWLGHATLLYLGGIVLLTVLVLGGLLAFGRSAGGTWLDLLAVAVVGLVPASSIAVHAVNWVVTHTLAPRRLPAMDYGEGIPSESRTIVVMPTMLTDADEVQALLSQLERHYLANADRNLSFTLLTDFPDASRQHMPDDDDLIDQAVQGIRKLNAKYGGASGSQFYLFHRERQWNGAEGYWMGWERKRGKLADFNRLLLGHRDEIHFTVQEGDLDSLEGIVYAITLDRDTIMPRDSARQLVATIAHPLNRAQYDQQSGAVVGGYTVLQPRLEVWPPSASRSLFAQLFAGDTVVDLYTRAVSDVYQDLFGEGNYAGKGIYDVAAFERSLAGRVPQNALLSHDLFEGIRGRAGLSTTTTFYEDFPPDYLAYAFRQHRWIRGDWQLLPWLSPRVPGQGKHRLANDFSLLDRWKIVDNLRRSLLSPSLLALLGIGWLWLPGSPLVWTLIALLIGGTPFFSQIAEDLLTGGWQRLRALAIGPLRAQAGRWLLGLVFLAYETLVNVDAIGSTLVRLFITHRHLLQWTTSAHTIRLFRKERKLALAWVRMASAAVLAGALGLVLAWRRSQALFVAAPFLLTWLVSPQIAYWISRAAVYESAQLPPRQLRQLRSLARRTWLFFEQFVGPDDHWLAPDHYQEEPLGQHARRTSPTNIGMQLVSTLGAYDLGYLGTAGLAYRLRFTFDSLTRMERYRGHLLNWYDTRDLHPLEPRYVSTVDSGNLAASLLVVKQGCIDVLQQPILRWQALESLVDQLNLLLDTLETLRSADSGNGVESSLQLLAQMKQRVLDTRDTPSEWPSVLDRVMQQDWGQFELGLQQLLEGQAAAMHVETVRDLRIWLQLTRRHLHDTLRDVQQLLPWLGALARPPRLFTQQGLPAPMQSAWEGLRATLPQAARLGDMPQICQQIGQRLSELQSILEQSPADAPVQEALTWCCELSQGVQSAGARAADIATVLQELAAECERLFQETDFQFLFDERREVFHIGYNVSAAQMDKNYYDLLASEARLASVVAIAKGDVPKSHWLHLSRPFVEINGARALLSWSGTMFEYLMPELLMRSYRGTLLQQTNGAVVERQMTYGREKGVPWGISESGYYRFDASMNYQYQAFGVPGLGLKRGLGEDLVIAPYASLLALRVRPRAVLDNLAALIKQRMLGHYGLYEAIDYTPTRVPQGQKGAIVRSYMAHHQGMLFSSVVNYLRDDVMLGRFHADPRIQATDLILHEQIPTQPSVEYAHPEETTAAGPAMPLPTDSPYLTSMRKPLPEVCLLSNGRYSVVVTTAGGGYSQWKDVALTRWRPDTSLDNWGSWIYVQDRRREAQWSAGYQPEAVIPDWEQVQVYAHKVEFRRKDHGIALRAEVTVSPDEDVEVRRVTLTNETNRRRRLWLTSYAEPVLARGESDARHQAFHKLFIESEYLPELNTLLFRRRSRSADEEPLYLGHLLVTRGLLRTTGDCESDRAAFLGRGRTPRHPVALTRRGRVLSGTVGATLDPIMCLGQSIHLLPHTTAQLAYVTLAANSRHEALALARRYQSWLMVRRAFGRARDSHREEFRALDLSTPQFESMQQLLSVLLYPHPALRADAATLATNRLGQSGLWPFAISGDYPILLVCIQSRDQAELLYEVLRAHSLWRRRQQKVDLVILNERETGYADELHGYLHRLIARTDGEAWLNRRGGIFVLRADQLNPESHVLLHTAARAILRGEAGSLADQVGRLSQTRSQLPIFVPTLSSEEAETGAEPTPTLERPHDLLFDNGLGGFSADGREYVIYLEGDKLPPAPWSNVIGNPDFGFLVTEAGSGYTWAINSGENRLTPWSNDPLSDTPGEALYLRDEETATVWSPTPLPASDAAPYLVRHGAGYSQFEHYSQGLKQRLRLFAATEAPVKVVQLRLENTWQRTRRITATYYAEWVLGNDRAQTQQYIVPEYDPSRNALLARNTYSEEFRERVAFLASSRGLHGLTCDRTEFLGREGDRALPAALRRIGLAGRVEAGLDPCAAAQMHIDLAPGQSTEVFFLLGEGADREEALRLVDEYQDAQRIDAVWQEVNVYWDRLLGTVQVQTPEPSMNVMLNRWLLYQALSCRIWGRSAFYQSSGAFGFRDQLQDVMALTHAAPQIARQHILRAARQQFEAGDVLHWWHPPSDRGVRTRYSDDLLWLPFVTAHYVTQTGDTSVLSEKVPFCKAEPLQAGERERYGHYPATDGANDLYEHCCRALDKGFTQGPHALPLMGGGDWNDGMNQVGIGGRGESVWLGWFLCAALQAFAPLCQLVGHQDQAAKYLGMAGELQEALEQHGWDGNWYLRAYFDDGTSLGSAQNVECQIASIAQSWAVLSGAADDERAAKGMEWLWRKLVKEDDRLALLFTPPFDKTELEPGYIKGYPPGVRENGGQYTHAALWAAWAFAQLGQGDRAEMLFRLLNPVVHGSTLERTARYKVEPYVVAADVYSHPAHSGRGGWTWYTGSAGWMYRLGVEAILGLQRKGDTLLIDPCIPQEWSGFTLEYRNGETHHHVAVHNPRGVSSGVVRATLDGEQLPRGEIPLLHDGTQHQVEVWMG